MSGPNFANSAFGSIAKAIGGSSQKDPYRTAYNDELGLQSKLAQAVASVNAHNESARLHGAQADAEETMNAARKPDAVLSNVLTTHGIPSDDRGAVREYLNSGTLGGKYSAPGGMGPVAPAPEYVGKLGDVARSIGTMQGALTLGDKSVENVAKAEGLRRDQQLSSDVIAGKVDPTRAAQGQYAASGKAPYSFHEFGTGNNLTGKVDDTNGPAVRFGQYRQAETGNQVAAAGAHKASAASSYASAENSRAHAAEARQRTEQGARSGDIQVVPDADGNIVLVNKVNGLSRVAVGMDGKPINKGTGSAKMTEDQGKATGWLIQANNAYKNMVDVIAKDPSAAETGINDVIEKMPGWVGGGATMANVLRGGPRQMYLQGASSLSEALLRAATGAGVNKDEAVQKVRELTPQVGDGADVRKQKMDAIPLFLEGLKVRAGPGAAKAAAVGAQAGPAQIKSDADFNALPSGAEFIAPDGSRRRKP